MLSLDALRQLGSAYAAAGRQLYAVGGYVRDLLLGRPTADYDFTTDALPDESKRVLAALRPEALYYVGEKFGTIGAIIDGHRVEITTFRGEIYSAEGKRHPTVAFGVSLQEDLSRRDFTINAMALDVQALILHLSEGAGTGDQGSGHRPLTAHPSSVSPEHLVDPFGGQADLAARVIRAVGAATVRFHEDPLRLLRAVRFATQLGFSIDRVTEQAIRAEAEMLAGISTERIAEEMNKLLLARKPSRGIRLLVDLGLMAHVMPEILPMIGMKQNVEHHHKDVYDHVLQVLDKSPATLHLRWAALLHDIAKPATFSIVDGKVHFYGHEVIGSTMARAILARLHFDHAFVDDVSELVAKHMRINTYGGWTDGAVRRFMREAGPQLDNLFALSRADITSHRVERVQAVLREVDELERRVADLAAQEEVAKLHSPLDGNDLMALFGRAAGPWIKSVKDYLLDLVLDGQLAQDDKEAATQLAHAFMAEQSSNAPAGQRTR